MELLIGEFKATLDEKGRICLPASLRRVLNEEKLILTQNYYDNCLWLFPVEEYKAKLKTYQENTNLLSKKDRDFRRRFFNSQEVEIDKAGRIPIFQNYREYAGLNKDCVFLAQGEYIEIWDEERYNTCLEDSKDDFVAVSEEMSEKLKKTGGDV